MHRMHGNVTNLFFFLYITFKRSSHHLDDRQTDRKKESGQKIRKEINCESEEKEGE